ncbi:MmcQ/YjbR family DNA-binding protein [Hymenobacter saemangeumensis]|uniref:MmcQ/YjbR family DNA-binding protein n=1 Tax=Hymenobacter saemangeumensis TaxID=1084522 RepID=A0ABP8ISJ0_9BACT
MNIEELQTICQQLPGTTEDIKWDYHLCFNVGGKMYLITSPDEAPPSASFTTTPEGFEELTARAGINAQKHLGRYGWVQVDDINLLTLAQWQHYIRESYLRVASKLSLKLRKQLGIVATS